MELRKYKLSQLLSIKNGKDYKHLDNGDVPVFGSGGFMCFVNSYLYDKVSILLPRKGTLSNIQFYYNGRFWTVDTCFYSIVNESLCDPYYLYRYIKSLDLSGYDTGASIPSMTQKTYNGIKVSLPSLPTQRRIASILSAYDNLIENNNKRIWLLEQMAENLYKEWFVRFRFPGHEKVEMENGLPKGWKVEKVQDWCRVFTGKKDVNQTVPNGKYAFFSCSPDTFKSNDYIYDGKAILVAGNGSYTGRTRYFEGKFDLYQRTYAVVSKNEDSEFLYYLYTRFKFDFEKIYSGGTRGSAIPYIVMRDLTRYRFLYEKNVVKKYTSIIRPLFRQIDILNEEIITLSRQRDLLLPRLMSGKLEVKV